MAFGGHASDFRKFDYGNAVQTGQQIKYNRMRNQALGIDMQEREDLVRKRAEAQEIRSTIQRMPEAERLDAAAGQEDALMAADQSRGDQSYYNYLQQLGMVAGFGGGPAATAVNASQAASGATVGAYAREGGNLSNIYSQLGSDQGNIAWQTAAGVNNALVSGASNYATYRAAA